jgi:hypothetical protein
MQCVVCHYCKIYWEQPESQSIEGVLHPPCKNLVRAVKRPPKGYSAAQQMAA